MSDTLASVGLRFVAVFELTAAGLIKPTGLTGYEGLQFDGPKAYALNLPEARKIAHQGRDRVIATDQLPTLEVSSAEIRVSTLNYELEALLTNVSKYTVGDFVGISRVTDQQGSEPQVGVMMYQQAKDIATGLRTWHIHIIPSTQAIPVPAGMSENPEDIRYTLAPTPTTKHLWGAPLVVGTEGVTEHGLVDLHGPYKPALEAFESDGIEDTFELLHTAANNTYTVWVDGVLRSSNITKTTTQFVFTSAIPADGANITVFYGQAN